MTEIPEGKSHYLTNYFITRVKFLRKICETIGEINHLMMASFVGKEKQRSPTVEMCWRFERNCGFRTDESRQDFFYYFLSDYRTKAQLLPSLCSLWDYDIPSMLRGWWAIQTLLPNTAKPISCNLSIIYLIINWFINFFF